MRWKKSHPEEAKKKGPRDDRKDIALHGGSYPLEEVKAMPEYAERIEQDAPKRSYALNIGYCGSAYQGLQTNEGAVTIEAYLERALLLAGGIKEHNFGNLQKIGWSRAARTDKGVHAVGQCVAMRLHVVDEKKFVDSVNKFLPSDIALFSITKTTKSFNARLHCSHRQYEYFLPSFLIQDHQEQEKVLKDNESVSDLSSAREKLASYRLDCKTLERFRETLRRFEGTHSFHNFTASKTVSSSSDSQVKRYIMSISCDEPFLHTCNDDVEMEWIKVTIVGQSFLLNQIRKMIGLAVDVTREAVDTSMFETAFSLDSKVNISMAPGLGLVLSRLYFDRYHSKLDAEKDRQITSKKRKLEKLDGELKDDAIEESEDRLEKLLWSSNPEVSALMAAFRDAKVIHHIFEQERDGSEFLKYLKFLRTCSGLYSVQKLT